MRFRIFGSSRELEFDPGLGGRAASLCSTSENFLRPPNDLHRHMLSLRRRSRRSLRWPVIALAAGSALAFTLMNFLIR
jgi:hypothetical protein